MSNSWIGSPRQASRHRRGSRYQMRRPPSLEDRKTPSKSGVPVDGLEGRSTRSFAAAPTLDSGSTVDSTADSIVDSTGHSTSLATPPAWCPFLEGFVFRRRPRGLGG